MACNFDLYNKQEHRYRYVKHIGKRFGSVYYCWDCHECLSDIGEYGIHCGNNIKCPKCGKTLVNDPKKLRSCTNSMKKGKGISKCLSFTWAMLPIEIKDMMKKDKDLVILSEHYHEKDDDDKESDHWFLSFEDFEKRIITGCPVQFWNLVGRHFS